MSQGLNVEQMHAADEKGRVGVVPECQEYVGNMQDDCGFERQNNLYGCVHAMMMQPLATVSKQGLDEPMPFSEQQVQILEIYGEPPLTLVLQTGP